LKKIFQCLTYLLLFSFNLQGQPAWTQKANFPGGPIAATVGFSIGHYGFIGCGTNLPIWNLAGATSDFWRWDAYTNTWTKIANYPGGSMEMGIGFTIEGKGFIGFGWNGAGIKNLYSYDTVTNAWTQMATFPGLGRYATNDFVIGHKAYIIGGSVAGPPYLSDVWVYDAHQNSWKQLNNFPENNIEAVVAFSIGNHGYAGNGYNNPGCYTTMYEYDTASDTWIKIAPIPYAYGVGGDNVDCSIGSRGYVFNGDNCATPGIQTGWMYDTVTKAWCAFTDIGILAISRAFTSAFVINNHLYMGTGYDTTYHNLGDLWEYTPSSKFTVSDTAKCGQDTVHFSGTTSYLNPTWKWSFPGGNPATSNLQNPEIIYSTLGTYKATLIIDACGGIDTVSRTITITGGSLASAIKGKISLCIGSSDTLVASGGGTYQWSNGATTSTIITTPYADTTYSVTVINGTCKQDTSIRISISKLTATISPPSTICQGDTMTLGASGGGTYRWSTGSSTSSISIVASFTTTYSVVITNGPCIKDTSVMVTVNPSPIAHINGTNQICKGDNDTLIATGGGTYLWNTGQTSSSITVTPNSTAVYTVVITNSFHCKADTLFQVNVALPIDSITGSSILCRGDSITLNAIGGTIYRWNTGATTSSIKVYPDNNTTYYVANACHDTTRKTVFVDNIFSYLYACCDTTIKIPGSPVILDASGATNYYWLPNTNISCDSCPNPIVTPTVTTTYTVITIDSAGCKAERSITIYLKECYFGNVPNVFTPNGDGINDNFTIVTSEISGYTISIYDRWGLEMFHSTNPTLHWDGSTKNGGEAPAGVYYYIIKYSCNEKSSTKDGFLQLIR